MSNIEEEINKCIESDPENKQKFNSKVIDSTIICSELGQKFMEKFFPDGDPIKMADNFAYKEEFTIVLFREASLWWNAQKSKYPLGNQNDNNGGMELGNMLINIYICNQIKNLEKNIRDNGIEIGQLNISDYLDIPAEEIINRDISSILKMGEDEDLPDITVPDANSSLGNENETEKSIIEQKLPDINEDDDSYPERELPEVSDSEIQTLIESMKDLKPGQKINYKGKVITILAPMSN